LRVRYGHTWKSAQIKRELEGINPSAMQPQDRLLTVKDLFYRQETDVLNLRAEAVLFQDLMIHVELPVILNQTSYITFDQEAGDGCRFGNDANPNCVNAMNSTTLRDGILPSGGFDAQRSGAS